MAEATVVGGTLADLIFRLPNRFLRQGATDAITLPFGAKLTAEDYVLGTGGSGANVAVGLARLGVNTRLISEVSTDALGVNLTNILRDEGVELSLSSSSLPSPLSVILSVAADRTIITSPQRAQEFLNQELPSTGWLHLGPLAPAHEDFWGKVVAHCVKHDQKISLNPSMVAIEDAQRSLAALLRITSILFVNLEEGARLARLSPKTEIDEIIAALRRLGPEIVCLTCGKKGAFAASEDGYWFTKALADSGEWIDATGAGDAFCSGFLAARLSAEPNLSAVEDVERAMRWAIVNSASVVAQPGATTGLLARSALEPQLKAVTIRRIN